MFISHHLIDRLSLPLYISVTVSLTCLYHSLSVIDNKCITDTASVLFTAYFISESLILGLYCSQLTLYLHRWYWVCIFHWLLHIWITDTVSVKFTNYFRSASLLLGLYCSQVISYLHYWYRICIVHKLFYICITDTESSLLTQIFGISQSSTKNPPFVATDIILPLKDSG